MSLNKVTLIGRVGRDPEVRRLQSGDPVVNFSIATSERWKDKSSGERKERTEWHNIVIFNEALCKIAEDYVKKGSQIYISGKIATREYTDRDGNQRKATEIVLQRYQGEIVLLDSAGGGGPQRTEDSYGKESTRNEYAEAKGRVGAGGGGGKIGEMIDDDVPF